MLVPFTATESEISQKAITLSSHLHSYSLRVRHLTKNAVQIRCITLNINYTDGIYIRIYGFYVQYVNLFFEFMNFK